MRIWKKIDKIISGFLIFLIKIYQYILSPDKGIPSLRLKGKICMHEPHCSEYGIKVFRRYGLFRGLFLTSDRVLHCTGGMNKIYDPEFYKVVFFSSAPIGVPFLEELSKDKRFEIVGVVTQCDKPAGRGLDMCENIIKVKSKEIFEKKIIDNVLLLDGFGGDGKSNRFIRLKNILESQGIKVYNPCPVNTNKPILKNQLDYLIENYSDKINEKTVIIGHSLGCLLANHFIAATGKNIGKLISVAPAFKENNIDLIIKKFPGFGEARDLLINYQKSDFDIKKLENLIDEHIVYISDNDPLIPFDMVNNYYKNNFSNIKFKYFQGKGHFNESAGVTQLPEILSDILFINTPNKLNPEKTDEGKEFAERLKKKEPDFVVVIAYGKIIPQAILDIPKIAPINVHGSLLPKYRGASPIQSIFLNNDKETGITIMKMDAGMDTGNMIEKLKFQIPLDRTCKDVIEKMKTVGPRFLNDVLWKYGKGLLGEEIQDNEQATYCNKIEKEDGLIDPGKDSLEDIYNKYRGFYLWPKTYFFFKKEGEMGNEKGEIRVIIEELKIDENLFEGNKDKSLINLSSLKKHVPSLAVEVAGTKGMMEDLLNPAVIEIRLKPEGKKAMDWDSFVNGYLK